MRLDQTRFSECWGSLTALDANLDNVHLRLAAPRDAADGIGSALAFGPPVPTDRAVTISWNVIERWGGEEDWRGFWIMFADGERRQSNPWPMNYFRPSPLGWEIGISHGPQPFDQEILSTLAINGVIRPAPVVALRADWQTLHLSVRWTLTNSISNEPTAEVGWLTESLRRPALHVRRDDPWPPLLGLYSEASIVEVRLS